MQRVAKGSLRELHYLTRSTPLVTDEHLEPFARAISSVAGPLVLSIEHEISCVQQAGAILTEEKVIHTHIGIEIRPNVLDLVQPGRIRRGIRYPIWEVAILRKRLPCKALEFFGEGGDYFVVVHGLSIPFLL